MKAKRVNGRFPSHDDRGRPLYYLTQTALYFCPACANGENNSGAHTHAPTCAADMDRRVYCSQPAVRLAVTCEHCGTHIKPPAALAPLATP